MTFTASPKSPVVRVTERNDKGTVRLHRGQRIRVVLHSTYWELQKPSNRAVLRVARPPKVIPRLSGCVAGGGCGTVTASYLAVASGSSTLAATRNSCGEAMGCTAETGRFTVRVVVR